MHNLLLDKLPQYTQTGKIRTDFRESIKFELLMQNKDMNKKDKIAYALNLYYPDVQNIKDINQAIKDILWFYTCGKASEKDNQDVEENEENERNVKQIYSYEFDDEYIYSAFLSQYGIDLNSINYLHWWKFKALMNSLNSETLFVKIMGYRSINLSEIKDKKMKKFYKKMKKIYALPDMRSEEEKENDFANGLWD